MQMGRGPVLIVSADAFNRAAPAPWALVVVVPLTTRHRGIALYVPIRPPEGGLRQPSLALPEQLYAADQRRLVERCGRVAAFLPGRRRHHLCYVELRRARRAS